MIKYDLYNLNLGTRNLPLNFNVGPYRINLVKDYNELIPRLSSLGTKYENAKCGENLITANVVCNNEPGALLTNRLNTQDESTPGIWDLCLILSYLSGHRVFTSDDLVRYHGLKFVQGVVAVHDIVNAAGRCWENRANFESEKEIIPLWYYLAAVGTSEAGVRVSLCSTCIDVITNLEIDKGKISIELQNLIDTVNDVIKKSTIETQQKNSFIGSVSNWGSGSAVAKFESFLSKYSLLPLQINAEINARIKTVNEYRNSVIHEGIFRKKNQRMSDDEHLDNAMRYAGDIIPTIVREYINRKFEINTEFHLPRLDTKNIKEFIETGTI